MTSRVSAIFGLYNGRFNGGPEARTTGELSQCCPRNREHWGRLYAFRNYLSSVFFVIHVVILVSCGEIIGITCINRPIFWVLPLKTYYILWNSPAERPPRRAYTHQLEYVDLRGQLLLPISAPKSVTPSGTMTRNQNVDGAKIGGNDPEADFNVGFWRSGRKQWPLAKSNIYRIAICSRPSGRLLTHGTANGNRRPVLPVSGAAAFVPEKLAERADLGDGIWTFLVLPFMVACASQGFSGLVLDVVLNQSIISTFPF